jgi:hypothetical protein
MSAADPGLRATAAVVPLPPPSRADETRGLWFGLLGVVIFAMTCHDTPAVAPADDPQLAPVFVVAAQAALSGLLGVLYLWLTGARARPAPRGGAGGLRGPGTVVGFPLFLGLALRQVDAMHGAVITGVLPLGTALVAALAFRQRPSGASGSARHSAARWCWRSPRCWRRQLKSPMACCCSRC